MDGTSYMDELFISWLVVVLVVLVRVARKGCSRCTASVGWLVDLCKVGQYTDRICRLQLHAFPGVSSEVFHLS